MDKSNPDDNWYFSTITRVDDFVLNVDDNEVLGETNIWINTIIKDKSNNKIGLAGTGLDLTTYLKKFIKNEDEYITPIIFDSSGAVQAYEDLKYIDKNSQLKEASKKSTVFDLIGNEGAINRLRSVMIQMKNDHLPVQTIDIIFNQQRNVAAITYIPEVDWYVTILFRLSRIYSIWDYSNIILVIIFVLIILVILTIYFTTNKVINPLMELYSSTLEIAAGNYNYKVKIEEENEFGVLASSFNEMAVKVNMYTDNLERLVEKKTAELRSANQVLEEKNQKITDSILYAQNIQSSIIPLESKLKRSFEDYFVIWMPKDIVGGDFYWYKDLMDSYLIAVVDCTGHGVPGALMAMTANTILQRINDNNNSLNPAEILSKLNKLLKEILYKNYMNQDIDDGLDIAICRVYPHKKECIFAAARLSLFYTKDKQLIRIKGDRQSIGYRRSSESFKYTNHLIKIKEDMNFYLTTDGYLDQNGGNDNKRLGLKTFMQLIEDNQDYNLNKQGEIFRETLLEHMSSIEQRDDITVVGFKVIR
ncbi:SpoIIE family protein phosphatase [Natronospora cellulosivora (SeqCode)]